MHDQVVHLWSVLHYHSMFALSAGVAQFGDRGRRVRQQPFLVGGIDPRARNHPRTIPWPDFVLHGVDQRVERGAIHQALFHEQRLERLDAQREIGRDGLMLVPGGLGRSPGRDPIGICRRRSHCRRGGFQEAATSFVHQMLLVHLESEHHSTLNRRLQDAVARESALCRRDARRQHRSRSRACRRAFPVRHGRRRRSAL